jgi:hypothetical protein
MELNLDQHSIDIIYYYFGNDLEQFDGETEKMALEYWN